MHIDLNRTFRTLVDDPTVATSDDARLVPSATSLKWADILELRRVVILSEAGAGKTEEIRCAALRLREEGKAAFFLRLEHISSSLEDAFEEGSHDEFESWLGSTQEGWLLLDSIDEARLRDPSDFERAVRYLGRKLQAAIQRTHVILTGRTAAWRPLTDIDLCAKLLPYREPDRSAAESPDTQNNIHAVPCTNKSGLKVFTIVALDDLSEAQVRQFAKAREVADVDKLLEEIERADGWSFTTRPLDLQELLEFWQSNKRIGSRLELLRASIDRRLREQDQTRDEISKLTFVRAREGARILAAACTLTLQQTIAVPDGSKNIRGLHLDTVLGDWPSIERTALLQRPVFDEEIYGTVRFHHRSVREYLTAEWFAELLKKDASRNVIESLFFREQYGLTVVSPVLRSILPWLAVMDPRIQERALHIAPEVLLSDGDPSQLLLETRKKILKVTCTELAAGAPRPPAEYSAIQRFAAHDLTQDVKQLLTIHKDEESQVFLLRMVWQGKLIGALQEVLQAAVSPTSGVYVRKIAIRAIAVIGSEKDMANLRAAFAQESECLNRDVLAELIEFAPRSLDNLAWLCDCLSKAADYHRFSADYLREAICKFVDQLDVEYLSTSVERFNYLLDEPPVIEQGDCDISSRNSWLLKPSALAVSRLIRERAPVYLSIAALAILYKLPHANHYELIEIGDEDLEIKKLVQSWPDLKFALFWYMVEIGRRKLDKKGGRLTDWWQADIWSSYVGFVKEDFDHALAFVSSKELIDDKLVALSLAFKLYVECDRPVSLRRRLNVACKSLQPLREKLQNLLRPPKQSAESIRIRRMNDAWKRRAKKREEKEKKNFEKSCQYLIANVESLRDPGLGTDGISHAQLYLHQRLRSSDKNSSKWSNTNWRSLESDFGNDVAKAFRDGTIAYWRKYQPILISEGAVLNSTPFSVIFGLTGLAIDSAETENWASKLSKSDVELVFRYAMRELNGFPDWLPSVFLISKNPQHSSAPG
jgi:hypothetical protein